jgi:hypothetical protein
MSKRRFRTVMVGGLCAIVGAAAGIAGSTAASNPRSKSKRQTQRHQQWSGSPRSARGAHRFGPGGPHGGVHAEETVLNRAGTAFITETEDSGMVVSVSGNTLTIKEAIGNVVYKDSVDLNIPDGATVIRNFKKAQLSALQAGDRVHVSSSSDGTFVFAIDPSSLPKPPRWGHGGPGHWGGPPPNGGPPPGAPSGGGYGFRGYGPPPGASNQ